MRHYGGTTGAPFYEPEQVRELADALHNVFQHVSGYGVHIPLYGAYWAVAQSVALPIFRARRVLRDDVER